LGSLAAEEATEVRNESENIDKPNRCRRDPRIPLRRATLLVAHHNIAAMYDAEKPVPLNGTVTAVQWRNPHVFVFVDVKDDSGSVVNWKVEWLAALVLSQQGFTRDSLHVGDIINMTACVAKDGSQSAAAQFVTAPHAFENHRVGLCKAVSR
jgi:hypothetical protein